MKSVIRSVIAVALVLSMVVALAGCAEKHPKDYPDSNNIVEAAKLEGLLSDSKTVVIDARSEEAYNKGHLKGAISLPQSALATNEPVKNLIAPKDQVEAALSARGISNDSNIYIYDDKDGIYASRVWWVLKVYGHENAAVINGGASAVVNAMGAGALTKEATAVTPSTYTAKEADLSTYASLEDVEAAIDNSEVCIIDVRSAAENAEGTIPTSILYPHTKNMNEDGTFLSAWEIYLDYQDKGFEKDEAIIVFCKSSVRAAQTMLLLSEAGYEDVKIYDGAWLEWSAKDDVPKVEQTEEKVVPTAGDGS